MRYSLNNTPARQSAAGFTLIEMLIIAPIVILALGGFIALMVTMVGNVLTTRDQTNMTYESQDTLNRVEDDIRLATQFLTTTGTLSSPQGSNDSTAAFTNSANNTLILYTLATTKNPADSSRELVYYKNQPYDCTTQKVFNQVAFNKVIYFIKNGSLWRRTIVPTYNTNATADAETVCTAPWQQNSCSPGYAPATRCQTNDIELMKNVSTLNVEYFSSSSSTTNIGASNAGTATTVKVTVTGSKNTAGHSVATSQSTRATRLNISVDPPVIIPLQFTQNPASQSVIYTDTNVQFSATPSLARATLQWERLIPAGSWTPIAGATSSTLTIPTVTTGMSGYQYRVKATTPEDGTITSDPATLTVSIWGKINYLDDFSDYQDPITSTGYPAAAYTKTAAGVVLLRGMVEKATPVSSGDVIGVLPSNARPSGVLIFQTSTNSNVASRVDVYPNGEIRIITGDAGWTSLEGISFIPTSTSYTRNTLTFANSWNNYTAVYGGPWANASYVIDSVGRVNVQGLVTGGVTTNGTQIVNNIPAAARTGLYMHVPAASNSPSLLGIDQNVGIVAKTGTNGFLSLNTMYHPVGYGGWISLPLQNGWQEDGGGFFTTAGYTKGSDNIVRLKGLIRNGTTTNGIVVATLPAGYRPSQRTLTAGACNPNVWCRMDVLTNGNVELYLSNSGWTSLDGITFLAEQ
jgi:competence protein ComGC